MAATGINGGGGGGGGGGNFDVESGTFKGKFGTLTGITFPMPCSLTILPLLTIYMPLHTYLGL